MAANQGAIAAAHRVRLEAPGRMNWPGPGLFGTALGMKNHACKPRSSYVYAPGPYAHRAAVAAECWWP